MKTNIDSANPDLALSRFSLSFSFSPESNDIRNTSAERKYILFLAQCDKSHCKEKNSPGSANANYRSPVKLYLLGRRYTLPSHSLSLSFSLDHTPNSVANMSVWEYYFACPKEEQRKRKEKKMKGEEKGRRRARFLLSRGRVDGKRVIGWP